MPRSERLAHPAVSLSVIVLMLLGSAAPLHAQYPDEGGIGEQDGYLARALDTLSLQGWNVIEGTVDDFPAFLAVHDEKPGWRFELPTDAGAPVLLRWREGEHHPGVGVLTYYSGDVGTHQLISIFRAVVVDLETGDAIDSGLAVHHEDQRDDPAALEQPDWQWTDETLIVEAPGEGTTVLMLPLQADDALQDY